MYLESEIASAARRHAEKIISENFTDGFYYHNKEHTEEVVEAAIEVGQKVHLDDTEMEELVIAAWLHDTGYYLGSKDHEEKSQQIAREFLTEQNYPEDRIRTVEEAIKATKIPQKPTNKVAEVLCDADLYHLATNKFSTKSVLLKKENQAVHDYSPTDDEWLEETIKFVQNHNYFTEFGKFILEPKKAKNLKKLKKVKKGGKSAKKYIEELESQLFKVRSQLEREKEIRPTRGIETMFRITSRNHLTLSAMADNKANIMISVNSIILSIILTVLFRKFEEAPYYVIPGIALTATCLATIIFAILATRPNISSGKFTEEDIKNRDTNLLFFGNFHGMEMDNYIWGMKEMMKDGNYLYGSLIKDIYFLGRVLGKKYRLLRVSYTIFMFGLVISILLFVMAQLYPGNFAVS